MIRLNLKFLVSVIMGLMFVFSGPLDNLQAKGMNAEASDPGFISGGGGIFYPFQGKSGFNAVVQATGKISAQERIGIELEYRNYETELFKAKDIDTQSYILRGVGQYFFRSQGISPYVGLGLSMGLNFFDEKEIEKKRPSVNIKQGWGLGYGILGLLGVEIPMGQEVVLFAEGRASGDFQLSHHENRSGKNKLSIENLSGLTGMGGIRFRY